MAVAMIGPKFYAWDRNGKPLAFGKLYTYQARTNVPKDTYQSEDQVVPNANPVILNGEGYANVYLSGSYKMVLKDDKDNEIWTSDPVTESNPSEWIKCKSATYLSPTSFKIGGNFTSDYEAGRRVRIDDGNSNYEYSTIKSSSFAAGETTVEVSDAVVSTSIKEVCVSIIGQESLPTFNPSTVDQMKSGGFLSGALVTTKGYTSAGDGGMATYIIKTASEAQADGDVIDEYGNHTLTNGNVAILQPKNGVYNVDQFGADPKGQRDSFASVQAAITTYKNIRFSQGEYLFSATLIIHNMSGMNIQGAGEGSTILKASTDLNLDTQRIDDLGLADYLEYATKALFLITEYDGENDRPLKAARNHHFVGFTVDFEGSAAERVAHAFTSPHNSHSQWKDIKVYGALSHYYGSVFSDERSRHYHLDWNNCRSIRSVHHCWNGYEGTSLVSIGTTWLYRNNSISTTDKGYEMLGLNYSAIDNSSCDNQKKGSYAIWALDCKGLNINEPGVETRYEQAGTDFGGGIIDIENSSVNLNGHFFVGGDRDGIGTGDISDYDDGSGTVTGSLLRVRAGSVVNWDAHINDAQIDAVQSNRWPLLVYGDSFVNFKQGKSDWGPVSEIDVLDSSGVLHTSNGGKITMIRGDGATSDFLYMDNIETSYVDQTTAVNDAAFDADALFGNRKYRVNMGTVGGNPEDYNLPALADGGMLFGVLEVIDASPYRIQRYTQTNADVYSRSYTSSVWQAWKKMTP